eukprot:1161457-Alexandrium_andersonii.AAC.1
MDAGELDIAELCFCPSPMLHAGSGRPVAAEKDVSGDEDVDDNEADSNQEEHVHSSEDGDDDKDEHADQARSNQEELLSHEGGRAQSDVVEVKGSWTSMPST